MTGLPPDWHLQECDLVTMMGSEWRPDRSEWQIIMESQTTSRRLVKEATALENEAIGRWNRTAASHERQTSR
jgi:hypothetical protein